MTTPVKGKSMKIRAVFEKISLSVKNEGLPYTLFIKAPKAVIKRMVYKCTCDTNYSYVPLTKSSLDIFQTHLEKVKANNLELNIVLGASSKAQEGWIPTEIEFLDISKVSEWERLFADGSISRILSEHVWEHLTEEDGIVAAKNCFKYLKSGGHIRIAVPDGFHRSKEYVEYVKPGGHGAGSDDHKILYNYKTLKQVFESAGFRVSLLEYWDESGDFHYNAWDIKDGFIERSRDHDERNKEEELSYTSLIIDGVKDA